VTGCRHESRTVARRTLAGEVRARPAAERKKTNEFAQAVAKGKERHAGMTRSVADNQYLPDDQMELRRLVFADHYEVGPPDAEYNSDVDARSITITGHPEAKYVNAAVEVPDPSHAVHALAADHKRTFARRIADVAREAGATDPDPARPATRVALRRWHGPLDGPQRRADSGIHLSPRRTLSANEISSR
jgi:hypothetical protein